jgi:predicted cupin superfamily sugar epimerase
LCSYITCDCDPAFVSVCKGDVVLKDLKLKAEALNSLRLPVTVKAGFVGTITLKVHFFIVPYMIVPGFNFVVFFLTSQYQVVVY